MNDLNLHPDSVLSELLRVQRVLPIVGEMTDSARAVDLAQVLYSKGFKVMEFPVRGKDQKAILKSISAVRKKVPDMMMGAGSIVTHEEWEAALEHGAQFGVSPGMSRGLLEAILRDRRPFIPGFQTVSEGMELQWDDFRLLKWFPAQACGGATTVRQISPTFLRGNTGLVPTGGIEKNLTADYLIIPGVTAVGASWMTPKDAVSRGDWNQIEALAAEAEMYATQNPSR